MVVTYRLARPCPTYMKPKDPPQAAEARAWRHHLQTRGARGQQGLYRPDRNLVLTPGPITCIMDTMIVTGAER